MVTTATKRAIGYLRVSTAQQTGERHSSLETQASRVLQLCQQRQYVHVEDFTEVCTGRKDDRAVYQRMVTFAKQGNADVIVVQFLDRFGRRPKEILRRVWELEDHGVLVEATDEDIREELMLLVKAGIAGQESRRTSERVRANMKRVVAKGVHPGKSPYGLQVIKRFEEGKVTRTWELHPSEAPVVRQIFELAVQDNRGYRGIADALNERGYRTRNGGPFSASTIQIIVSNEAMAGNLLYGRRPRADGSEKGEVVRVDGFFPSILTKDEWKQLQDRLEIRRESSRGRAHSSEYLLSGILRCGYCGGPMNGKVSYVYKGTKRQYRNYVCARARASREHCSVWNGHSVAKLEAAILEHLGQFSDATKVREHLAKTQDEAIPKAANELRRVEKQLAALDADFHKNLDLLKRGILDENEFNKANQTKRQERTSLESQRATLAAAAEAAKQRKEMAQSLPTNIQSFFKDFRTLDIRHQKAQLQTILKAVHVYRDGKIEVEFRC